MADRFILDNVLEYDYFKPLQMQGTYCSLDFELQTKNFLNHPMVTFMIPRSSEFFVV